MSSLKSLKECLLENLQTIIKDAKEKDSKGELKEQIKELEGLCNEMEEQIVCDEIRKKQGMAPLKRG